MFAHRLAGCAVEPQPVFGFGHRGDGHHGVSASGSGAGQLESKQIAAKINIAIDIDVLVGRSLENQLPSGWAQELTGSVMSQLGKPISQREVFALFGFCTRRVDRHGEELLMALFAMPVKSASRHAAHCRG